MFGNSDSSEINICLSGKKLYGNDFSPDRIDEWLADERESYLKLTQSKQEYIWRLRSQQTAWIFTAPEVSI